MTSGSIFSHMGQFDLPSALCYIHLLGPGHYPTKVGPCMTDSTCTGLHPLNKSDYQRSTGLTGLTRDGTWLNLTSSRWQRLIIYCLVKLLKKHLYLLSLGFNIVLHNHFYCVTGRKPID